MTGVENAAYCAPGLVLCFGQGDELLPSPGTVSNRPRAHSSLACSMRSAREGHEIPPNVARPSHGRSAEKHEPGFARRPHRNGVARSQHQKLTGPNVSPATSISPQSCRARAPRKMARSGAAHLWRGCTSAKRFGGGLERRARAKRLSCDQARRHASASTCGSSSEP